MTIDISTYPSLSDRIMQKNNVSIDKDSYELDSIIGADTKKVYEMKKFVDYKSKYFQIKANAVYDEESIVIRTVVDKSGNIVYWGVE